MANPTDKTDRLDEATGRRVDRIRPHETTADGLERTQVADALAQAGRTTEDIAESFSAVPYEKQVLVYLDFKDTESPVEIKPLPGHCRILTITTQAVDSSVLDHTLQSFNLTRPLNTGIRNPKSQTVTSQHLVPHPNNTLQLLELANINRLRLHISSPQEKNTAVIRINGGLMAIDPSLFDDVSADPPKSASLTLTSTQRSPVTLTEKPKISTGEAVRWSPTYTSLEAFKLAAQVSTEMAETAFGGCTYLVVDLNTLLKDKTDFPHIRHILNQVAALARSEDFMFTCDNAGNLVIISLAQRGGGFLMRLAGAIKRATGGKTNILIGSGELHQDANGNPAITDYPEARLQQDWKSLGRAHPDIYITPANNQRFSEGRDSTTARAKTAPLAETGQLLKVTEIEKEASLRVGGGPDRLIGYQDEIATLKKATDSQSRSKLIILKGRAGQGKSRLLSELNAEQPNLMKISIDPAGENVQGYALVSFADQLNNIVERTLGENARTRYAAILNPLSGFSDSPEAQKIKTAQTNPREITSLCLSVLQILERCQGNFTLAVDDTHHIDRHSDPHLMNLVYDFLRESNSKTISSLRPEERYKSLAQKTLETRVRAFGGNSIVAVELENPETGTPKLNLKDPKTASDYVFYSLPEEIRINRATGSPRKVTSLAILLASRIETPFQLTSLINIVLRKKENLIIGDDEITLHPRGQAAIDKIHDAKDLAIYQRERVRKLTAQSRTLLQCIALMGSRVSLNQMLTLARSIVAIPNPWPTIKELEAGGYIDPIEDPSESSFSQTIHLQHETIRDTVLQAMNPKQRRTLAIQLYNATKEDSQVHNDTLFALLCEAADDRPFGDQAFWHHYAQRAQKAFAEASAHNAHGRAYGIAMTVLNGLENDKTTELTKALNALKSGSEIPGAIPAELKKLLADSLLTAIENGVYLGKFAKVHQAVKILEDIGAQSYLTRAYLAGFNAAYVQADKKNMDSYYKKLKERRDVSPVTRLGIELRLALKKEDFTTFLRLYEKHEKQIKALQHTNKAVYDEFERLKSRVIFEEIRADILDKGMDGDVLMEPGALCREDSDTLIGSSRILNNLNAQRIADPQRFSPIAELALLDQLADNEAFLGHYEEAIAAYGEIWRLATQMEIPREAARAAKTKGDIEIMQALANIEFPEPGKPGKAVPHKVIHRDKVLKALHTYTEEGLGSLTQVDKEEYYQILLRCQRVRATALLILSYQNEIDHALKTHNGIELQRIKNELSPHLKNAIEDFEFINASSIWSQYLKSNDGEFSYYITSNIGHILHLVSQFELTSDEIGAKIPNIMAWRKYQGFLPSSIGAGLGFVEHKNMHDNVGEVDRKLDGFHKLIELAQTTTAAGPEIERFSAFQNLARRLEEMHRRRSNP